MIEELNALRLAFHFVIHFYYFPVQRVPYIFDGIFRYDGESVSHLSCNNLNQLGVRVTNKMGSVKFRETEEFAGLTEVRCGMQVVLDVGCRWY